MVEQTVERWANSLLSDPLDKTATLTLWDSWGKRRCPKWGIRLAVIFPLCLLSGDRSLACDYSCWIIGERKGKRRGCKSDVLWHATEASISATMLFVMFCQLLLWSWTTFIIFGISNTSNILGQGKYLTVPVLLIHPHALKSCRILVKYCHTQVVGGMVPAVKVRRVELFEYIPLAGAQHNLPLCSLEMVGIALGSLFFSIHWPWKIHKL